MKRGPIGAVGASGTGLQQVTVLVDRLGLGISQAIGTGGRDLHSEIGGISMSKGLRDLAADPATKVIVLISKPPAAEVAERILSEARKAGKPVVVNFLGADPSKISGGNVHGARTLEDAARAAVAIARGEIPRQSYGDVAAPPAGLPPLGAGQRYIRGLFSGGTFCYEAVLLLDERLADVYSNTPVRREGELSDLWHSHHHTMIDLGDDVFTRGRPHPMIDLPPAQRAHRQGGGGSGDGGDPARRRARLWQQRGPCRRAGSSTCDARARSQRGTARNLAFVGACLRHRGRPARARSVRPAL